MKGQESFFDFAAQVGLTKHIGGLDAQSPAYRRFVKGSAPRWDHPQSSGGVLRLRVIYWTKVNIMVMIRMEEYGNQKRTDFGKTASRPDTLL
jgi:hypothetical protein